MARGRKAAIGGLVVLALGVAAWHPVRDYQRSACVLTKLAGDECGALLPERAVRTEELEFDANVGKVRARVYRPEGGAGSALVLIHGVHEDGYDEPRLMGFARAIASQGVTVMTPHLRLLAEFQVDPRTVATIGDAAEVLARREGRKVGLMGLSFSGGLALMAAARPEYAEYVDSVVAIGSHGSMARVARFLATDKIERPDGTTGTAEAHDYGIMVVVDQYPEDFFPKADAAKAREALGQWIAGDYEKAQQVQKQLPYEAQQRLYLLFSGKGQELKPELLKFIAAHEREMDAVSPQGKLGGLKANVYLLHGGADTVIPPAESEWLAREVPPGKLRALVISPLITHVELAEKPATGDYWRVLDALRQILHEMEN